MGMYLIIMFSFFLFILVSNDIYKKKIFGFVCVVLFSFVAGFRYEIGTDFNSYLWFFNNVPGFFDKGELEFIREPGFILYIYIIKSLGLGSIVYFGLLSFITSLFIYKTILKICPNHLIESLFVYFCFFFLTTQLNAVRHGVMLSFVAYSFTFIIERNFTKYMFYLLIGMSFHSLAFIFIPLYWLFRIDIKLKTFFLLMIASIILGNISLFSIVISILPSRFILFKKIYFYMYSYGSEGYGVSLGLIVYSVLTAFLMYYKGLLLKKNKYYLLLINCLLFAILSAFIFNEIAVFVERIVGVLYISLIFLLPMISNDLSANSFTKFCFVIIVIIYGISVFLKISNSEKSNGQLQYIPYKTVFSN